uniref:Uncharacterized protein n=1 Tax=Tetraselmis chuii TaxID=63592 RepID=A0A7S1X267_9CHLO|mmetsp:Transcript_20673/g.36883  ORF Transcript_20673/g.36883 Transcript_20673/m.36883 type:complete len:261 (+) Transcript_20673:138-920(+)|eukprot:CAMPEP_0177769904 /NCGR_PEP_ID=MMETSP0491_2-20121128/10608_1 /TAXON_ID=63592 /ORGANISM="Tetraselmis chuii, Strain PLY429" /LENGTH=260 /DNA_ID=CAMNT_0019287019 /DNA_START=123 /DNA_END=905 /DNA_ORIENTATION=-
MDPNILEKTLEAAVAAAEAHASTLAAQLASVKSGAVPGGTKGASQLAGDAKSWHSQQVTVWNGVLAAMSDPGGRMDAALSAQKYSPISAEALSSLRPDPPAGRALPSAGDALDGDPSMTAAEVEYQAIRTQLKNAMKLNPLVGEMQQTVTRRMHAVPALGSVPLPKASVLKTLQGTGSAAARDIVASQSAAMASQARPSSVAAPDGVPPWKAELQRRQSQVQGGSSEPVPSAPRPSIPSGMNSELEAVLARRRSSATTHS